MLTLSIGLELCHLLTIRGLAVRRDAEAEAEVDTLKV
jgi:hypothetical protein